MNTLIDNNSEIDFKKVKRHGLGNNTFCLFWFTGLGGGIDAYFRVFGKGFGVQPLKGHTPLWSERNGKLKAIHRFGHCWRFLA